ncbi:glutamic acid-rich protein-like [Engraulis encrasicolus]|uniref:glutamic acid-rich protein-like n=1 Tax=Engraulis encrasicolus TaxID=184585 RepID=UPI002FD3837B
MEARWRQQEISWGEEKARLLAAINAADLAKRRNLRQSILLRDARAEKVMDELRNKAAEWMVAPWDGEARGDIDVPLVLSTWGQREENRRVQEGMPLLHNHLQEFFDHSRMVEHLVQQQQLEAGLEKKLANETKTLNAKYLREREIMQKTAMKKREELLRKLLKEAEKKKRRREEKQRKEADKLAKHQKKEAERFVKEAAKVAKKAEKEAKKEAARAERAAAAGGSSFISTLLCCFRRRAAAASS